MAERRILPIVDHKGRTTHWKCSACNWTLPTHSTFTGLTPSPYSQKKFQEHVCAEHQKASA